MKHLSPESSPVNTFGFDIPYRQTDHATGKSAPLVVRYEESVGEPPVETMPGRRSYMIDLGAEENPASLGSLRIDDHELPIVAQVSVVNKPGPVTGKFGKGFRGAESQFLIADMRNIGLPEKGSARGLLGCFEFLATTSIPGYNGALRPYADFCLVNVNALKRGEKDDAISAISMNPLAPTGIAAGSTSSGEATASLFHSDIRLHTSIEGILVLEGSDKSDAGSIRVYTKHESSKDYSPQFLRDDSRSRDSLFGLSQDGIVPTEGFSTRNMKRRVRVGARIASWRKASAESSSPGIDAEIAEALDKGKDPGKLKRDLMVRYSNSSGDPGEKDEDRFKFVSGHPAFVKGVKELGFTPGESNNRH